MRAKARRCMLLFILGLFIGWLLGVLLTSIIAVGKRDDMITEEMYKKLDWT
jgi:hypothetical protein